MGRGHRPSCACHDRGSSGGLCASGGGKVGGFLADAFGVAGAGERGHSGEGRRGARARRTRGGGGKTAKEAGARSAGLRPVAVCQVLACPCRGGHRQHNTAASVCVWGKEQTGAQCGGLGLDAPICSAVGERIPPHRQGFQFPARGPSSNGASGAWAPTHRAARGVDAAFATGSGCPL